MYSKEQLPGGWGDGHLIYIIYNNVIYIRYSIHNVINKLCVCFVIQRGGGWTEIFLLDGHGTEGQTHKSKYRGGVHQKKSL